MVQDGEDDETADTSDLKQVEIKLLDFNWMFIGTNAERFVEILAETDNDEIFKSSQIRVMIDFLWDGYFQAIKKQLFYPFVLYFLSFGYLVIYLSKEHNHGDLTKFIIEMTCLVVAGKCFMHFLLLECIQVGRSGWSYFSDIWNWIDIASLVMNASYVYLEMTNVLPEYIVNIVGSIAIFIMWVKFFYWMRIFKSYAAFIRMVSDQLKSINVFVVMMSMCLLAFASVIIVLQHNRGEDDEPIFDEFVGFQLADAVIHAYLTGLGDFNKDNYSGENKVTVWIMFLIATVIVQLVFMNMLIAIMAAAYEDSCAIEEQAVLKELCSMMVDNIWLLEISEIFKNSRYVLWFTPDRATQSGTAVERQISNLRDHFKTEVETGNTKILSAIQLLTEDVDAVKTQLTEIESKRDDENEEEEYDD